MKLTKIEIYVDIQNERQLKQAIILLNKCNQVIGDKFWMTRSEIKRYLIFGKYDDEWIVSVYNEQREKITLEELEKLLKL